MNIKKFLLLITLLVGRLAVHAQSDSLPVINITKAAQAHEKVDGVYWQILPDLGKQLRFDQVINKKFAPVKGKLYIGKGDTHIYWLRYKVKNVLSHSIDINIPNNLPRLDVYISRHGKKTEKRRTGFYLPLSQKTEPNNLDRIDFKLGAGEEVLIYERNEFSLTDPSPTVGVFIYSSPNAIPEIANIYEQILNERENLAFASGFSIVTAIVSLFFFFVVRERIYLFFSIFVFCVGVLMSFRPYFKSLFPEFSPFIPHIDSVIAYLTMYLMLNFLINFFQTNIYFPKLYNITNWLNLSGLVVAISIYFLSFYPLFGNCGYLNFL